MDHLFRRYEVLLPLKFNDGRPVPDEAINKTLRELEEQFGPVSCETQNIRGFWTSQGTAFRDDLIRLFVDVPDTAVNRQFFVEFKERLKERFEQLDIWLTTHPLDVI